MLARYGHLEDIPAAAGQWDITVRGGAKLAATLQREYEEALLFRRIATIESDAPVSATVDELEWVGPSPAFADVCARLDAPAFVHRVERLAARLG